MQWFYTVEIGPKLTYWAVVWRTVIERVPNVIKLAGLKRLGCCVITGAMRNSPREFLNILQELTSFIKGFFIRKVVICNKLFNLVSWKMLVHSMQKHLVPFPVKMNVWFLTKFDDYKKVVLNFKRSNNIFCKGNLINLFFFPIASLKRIIIDVLTIELRKL